MMCVAVMVGTHTSHLIFDCDRKVPKRSATKAVLFSDNYQPYGQDNLASGSETYNSQANL